MSEHTETGFAEAFAALGAAEAAKAASKTSIKQQSQQLPWPNAGNTAAQPPANAALAPAKPRRAVAVANLPAVPAKREWLCGTDLMRGAVSMLVAPGARAKTTGS